MSAHAAYFYDKYKINLQSDLRNYLEAGNTAVINPNDFIRRTVTDGTIIDEYLKFIDAQGLLKLSKKILKSKKALKRLL